MKDLGIIKQNGEELIEQRNTGVTEDNITNTNMKCQLNTAIVTEEKYCCHDNGLCVQYQIMLLPRGNKS